jgi:endonuclease YncB( thermonuclease family)
MVAVCKLDGQDLNAWLVQEGLAVAYRHFSDDYVVAEDAALTAKPGLWGGEFLMPWEWRRRLRK